MFLKPMMLSFVMAAGAATAFAQDSAEKPAKPAKTPMPVYVTPYFESDGLKISVGPQSKRLVEADAKTIGQVVEELAKEKEKLPAEVMYVAAIRLYDLGQKDEAVYWFYTAQYRAKLFHAVLDKDKIGGIGAKAFELSHAYVAFNQLAGEYINGYAFGDLPKLEATLAKVAEEGRTLPKLAEIYPGVDFLPEETWAGKNKESSENLKKLVEMIKSKADYIKEQRRKNGVEGKY